MAETQNIASLRTINDYFNCILTKGIYLHILTARRRLSYIYCPGFAMYASQIMQK